MGSRERRLRHRAELSAAILDAALDIIAEQGLGALSIRAVADRVEYSAATIYLHFESKEALLREVAQEGFRRMHESVAAALAACGEAAEPAVVLRALARAYLDFALQHTAYFRVMFDVPPVPAVKTRPVPPERPARVADTERALAAELSRRGVLQQLAGETPCQPVCAERLNVPVAAMATVHGLVSMFLSGRLDDVARTPDELLALAEQCVAPYAAR